MIAILANGREEMKAKGWDDKTACAGVGYAEHIVRASVFCDQLDASFRKFKLGKRIISAKHLVTAVKNVHSLLAPRTVFIVVVQTQTKRILAYVINFLKFRITARKGNRGKRIIDGKYLYLNVFERKLRAKLGIAKPQTAKITKVVIFTFL